MKKLIVLSTSILMGSTSYAQPPEGHGPNLVPNHDFEQLEGKAPSDDVDGSGVFRYNMVEWESPTKTTPDVKIVLPSQVKQAAKKGIKLDKTHSGYKMVAILTHNPESKRSVTYREYIQVKLDKATKKDEEYYFEFWVCRARLSKFVSNNLGLVLSPTRLRQDSWEPLTEIKPDFNYDKIINANGREWVRISGTLNSANRSEYLIIGNFYGNDKTKMVEAKDKGTKTPDEAYYRNSYYLIDDVMLCEVRPTPEPEPEPEVIPEPEPEPVEEVAVGTVIQLDRVFFESAKWALLEESNEQLGELMDLLEKYPSMEIEIHGHTDSRGGDSYNQRLSENRTRSVYEYLIEQGIEEGRLGFVGYGEEKPIGDNETIEGRQMNRRVEFVVTRLDAENTKVEHSNEVKPYTDRE